MLNPIVYLPLEMKSREFASKLLLATELAARGYTVVVGQQWMLYANLDRLPRGAILFKSFNKIHLANIATAKQLGYWVLAQEEELLGIIDSKHIRESAPPELFDLCDVVLAHGDFEREVLQSLNGNRAQVISVGNGRLDILKPAFSALYQAEVDAIKRKYGDFVLVNTNYGVIHNSWGDLDRVKQLCAGAGAYDANNPESVRTFDERVEWERQNLAAMRKVVAQLAQQRPDLNIVVRPHPAEDVKHWAGLFPGLNNVHIVREGAHVPWTLAARLLLHTSCTTGFEAQVAGKPAISYVPYADRLNNLFLSNHVNQVVRDEALLMQAIDALLDRGVLPKATASDLAPAHYIRNLADVRSTKLIADLIAAKLPKPASVALPTLQAVERHALTVEKFSVSPQEFLQTLQQIGQAAQLGGEFQLQPLGDSLFSLSNKASPQQNTTVPFDFNAIAQAMLAAINGKRPDHAYALFKEHFAEAHRHPKLCHIAGVALGQQGNYPLALAYLQQASLNTGIDHEVSFALAQAYRQVGEHQLAWRYAKEAYQIVPTQQAYYELLVSTAAAIGAPRPQHWLVFGDSHVRYFRYMQTNRARFFDELVHLECFEFGGATAYGLKNTGSQSGALDYAVRMQKQFAQADRILIYFGEVDCRRAAWKAAQMTGKPIERTIEAAAENLESFLKKHILPYKRSVLILGAKPQIVQDEDFYANSLEDDRIVFQPITERQRVTTLFNRMLADIAKRHSLDYADIDAVLATEPGRAEFYRRAFWDSYTTDTHGNLDYFASLYYQSLREFAGAITK